MDRLKENYNNYKGVIKNFSYLSILQVFNLTLPLLAYPYLIRVLGVETYGIVVFAQAIMMYFSMLINFGFNISATKDIAQYKEDKIQIDKIVSSVYSIKMTIWVLSFLLLLVLIIIIPTFKENWFLFVITFGVTFNDLLFPQWFFLGVEKMKYITFINITSKVIFTCLIFICISEKEDYILVPVFHSVGAFIGGIISIYILVVKEKVRFSFQKIKILKFYFIESLPLFISAASIQIYVNANRVLVGLFLGMSEVAYYDLGEKILRLIKMPVGMLGQVTFSSLAIEKSIAKINKFTKIGVLLTLLLVIQVILFSEFITVLLAGKDMIKAVPIMRILSISALMYALGQFLGNSRLIIFGYKKEFSQIYLSTVVLYCLGASVLNITNNISLWSLAWLVVAVDFVCVLLMIIVNYQKKLLV